MGPLTRSEGRSSLACRSGLYVSVLTSSAILLAHLFFGYAQGCGQNSDCNEGEGTSCSQHEQGGQLSVSGGGLFRGEVTAHFDFEARGLLSLATLGAEGVACPELIECTQGKQSPILLPPDVAGLCTVLECGGGTMQETLFRHSYW